MAAAARRLSNPGSSLAVPSSSLISTMSTSSRKQKIVPSYADEGNDDDDICLPKKKTVAKRSKPSSSSSKNKSKPSRLCSVPKCTKQIQQGGVCCRHGAKTTRATCRHADGCTNVAKRGGLCRRHGAFVLPTCKWGKGCKRVARRGAFCEVHTAKGGDCPSVKDDFESRKAMVRVSGGVTNAKTNKAKPKSKAKSKKGGGGEVCVDEHCSNTADTFIPPLPPLPFFPTPNLAADASGGIERKVYGNYDMGYFPTHPISGLCKQVSSETCISNNEGGSIFCDRTTLTTVRQQHGEQQQQICNHDRCQNEAVFDGTCVTHSAKRRIYAKNNNNNGGGEGAVTDDSNDNIHGNELKLGAANTCWSPGEGNMAEEGMGGVGDVGQLDFLCDFEDLYDPFT